MGLVEVTQFDTMAAYYLNISKSHAEYIRKSAKTQTEKADWFYRVTKSSKENVGVKV